MDNDNISFVRRAARWGIRRRLQWRMERARGGQVKLANAALNWREYWHGRTRLVSRPCQVQIGTNWTCNLRCNFCRLSQPATRVMIRDKSGGGAQEISPRALQAALEIMPYATMVTLTPLGEPLLYSGFGRILERHRQLDCRNLALTTNTNLIDDDRARMLVEGGVCHLFVSIDTDEPGMYAAMRTGGDLARAKAAIEAVNHWKQRLGSVLPSMTLASTFMERNVRRMPALLDFAARNNIAGYSVQLMETENPELEDEFLGNHIGLAREMVNETLRRAAQYPQIDVRIHMALQNLLDGAGGTAPTDGASDVPLTGKCLSPWYFLLIDTDGDCRPCCWASASFGNLNSQSFEAVWNAPSAVGMRRAFLANRIPASCRGKHCRVDA